MLDGIESRIQFISMDIDSVSYQVELRASSAMQTWQKVILSKLFQIKPGTNSISEIARDNDAFIVVYSISDKQSFSVAIDLLRSIRMSDFTSQPVILVGHKSDLGR